MKLYYAPAACSMSPHIIAHELGITLDIEKVDLGAKRTENGEDYLGIVPKGYIPALKTDSGEIVTEGVAIALYLSGLKPEKKLSPARESAEFIPFLQTMLFITTELHKGIGGLFAPLPEEAKDMIRKRLGARLGFIADQLKGKEYIYNNQFSVADAYLFTVLNWAPMVKLDLSPWPVLGEYQARIASRPSVREAMKLEGVQQSKAA